MRHGSSLSPAAKLVAMAARQYSDWPKKATAGKGEVMTVPQWSNLTGLSESTVKAALRALVLGGWLVKSPGKRLPGNPKDSPRYDLAIPLAVHDFLRDCPYPHRCSKFLRSSEAPTGPGRGVVSPQPTTLPEHAPPYAPPLPPGFEPSVMQPFGPFPTDKYLSGPPPPSYDEPPF